MAELEAVVAQALPAVSAAVGAYGVGVLERVRDAAVDGTADLGRRLLHLVWHRAAKPGALESAVAEVAEAPEDSDALAALRLQIRKVLAKDQPLLEEIAQLLARSEVAAGGERAVAIGGDNNGITSTGDGAVNVQWR